MALVPGCPICTHSARASLDQMLLDGRPYPEVAEAASCTVARVNTHAKRHLRESFYRLERGFDLREVAYARSLAQRAEALLLETVDILEAARIKKKQVKADVRCVMCKHEQEVTVTVEVSDISSRVAAAREVRSTLETIGKISGEIKTGDVKQLFINLGVRNEDELRSAIALKRSADAIDMDDCYRDAVALLEMVLREQPQRERELRRWLDARSLVEVMDGEAEEDAEHVAPELAQGTGSGEESFGDVAAHHHGTGGAVRRTGDAAER